MMRRLPLLFWAPPSVMIGRAIRWFLDQDIRHARATLQFKKSREREVERISAFIAETGSPSRHGSPRSS